MLTIVLVVAFVLLLVVLGLESNNPQAAKVVKIVEIDEDDTQTIRAKVKAQWRQE